MDKNKQSSPAYILLDRKNNILGRGTLESPADAPTLYLRVPQEDILDLARHEIVQLISVPRSLPSVLGRITGYRRDLLIIEPSEDLAEKVRQNVRVPIAFDSYIYPLTGSWRGRRYVVSNDLSCGGISFYCEEALAPGEQLEVVIPITTEPLILRCQILRVLSRRPDGAALYASKFVDLCDDEEFMTREAVFSVQVQTGR